MSNPLLQPDGRFRRESVVDDSGRNRFADPGDADEAAAARGDLMASPSDASQPAYEPRFATHHTHRGTFIAWLGGIGFFLTLLVLLVFTRYALIGFLAAVLGVAISLATVVIGY